MIRVLIADDSAAVRALLVGVLGAAEGIEVVGEAATGAEVVRLAGQLRPDVITMDIHMPVMDGLAATEAIMHTVPTPIVIVSSAVRPHDVEMTMNALQVGAVGVLPKPTAPGTSGFEEYETQLAETVRAMAHIKVVRRRPRQSAQSSQLTESLSQGTLGGRRARLVAIAASTGGPAALQTILPALPKDFPVPVLVVQHIAEGFVPAMAGWLGQTAKLPVVVAEHGAQLRGGVIYVAPSTTHLGVSDGRIVLSDVAPIGGFRPSGTYLFNSVAAAYGSSALGVILTGMGRDGVEGLRRLHDAGGFTIAQDEGTSVVFGMPAEAIRVGAATQVLPLDQIGTAIVSRVQTG